MSADFGISALTVGHLRWVCWHHVRHYHDSACGGYRTPDERELCGSSPQRRIKSTQGPVVDYGRVISLGWVTVLSAVPRTGSCWSRCSFMLGPVGRQAEAEKSRIVGPGASTSMTFPSSQTVIGVSSCIKAGRVFYPFLSRRSSAGHLSCPDSTQGIS